MKQRPKIQGNPVRMKGREGPKQARPIRLSFDASCDRDVGLVVENFSNHPRAGCLGAHLDKEPYPIFPRLPNSARVIKAMQRVAYDGVCGSVGG